MTLEGLHKIFKESNGVCTDSRKIIRGSIFFALKGDNFNGNEYALRAIRDGCAYAVADDPKLPDHDQLIKVGNVLLTLQNLAQYHRIKWAKKVIGITGSNGKTTTKELVHEVLSRKFKTLSTEGNLNNHIGVPLSLLKLKEEHELAIIEMGANHVGEIKILCEIAQPDFGLITNIGKAHIGEFGSFEAIVKAKKELFDYVINRDGLLFFNADDQLLCSIVSGRTFSYGNLNGKGDVKGELIPGSDYLHFKWNASQLRMLKTKLVGSYNYYNALAAVTIGVYFKVGEGNIVKAIENYVPKNNRSQMVESGKNKIVLDAYNANPSSTEAALKNLKSLKGTFKYAVLGDMLELGESEIAEHQRIIALARELSLEGIFIGGLYCRAAVKLPVNVFNTTDEAKEFLIKNPIKNALVLLKGSRKMGLEKLLECF